MRKGGEFVSVQKSSILRIGGSDARRFGGEGEVAKGCPVWAGC